MVPLLWCVYVASAVLAGVALLHVQVRASAPHAVRCLVYHLVRQGAQVWLLPREGIATASVLAVSSYAMLYRHMERQKMSVVRPDVAIALSYVCACAYDSCIALEAVQTLPSMISRE